MAVAFGILGPLTVTVDGLEVPVSAPKQRAVVVALLVEANRVVTLDRLVDLLWAGEAPPQAVGSLQAYVSHLRRLLEPGRGPRVPPTVLVSTPPGYVIKVADGCLDSWCFEAAVSAGGQALRDGRPGEALARLDAGLALWRGRAFGELADQPFVTVEAARLDEMHLVGIELRVEARLALGEHRAMVAELEARVTENPRRERVWADLMLALYRSDRQSDALRVYQRLRRFLGDELGLEPGSALQQLEADIVAQRPSLGGNPPPARSDGPAAEEAAGAALVGRRSELGRLAGAWGGARAGRGGAVLIAGEAGIGKTKLVEALALQVAAAGGRVARGHSHEGDGAPAFWLWSQVVGDLAAGADPGFDSLVADADEAAFRLFEHTTALLRAAAAQAPLAVILEDLHWADAPSLRLLAFAAPRLGTVPLLLAGTYRDDEVGEATPLAETLGILAPLTGTSRLALHPFTAAEVLAYAFSVTGRSVGEDVAEVIHARTHGNPFFVAELVKLLEAEGSLGHVAQVRDSSVPVSVRDVIRRRISRLPEQTNALVAVASVIGEEFDLATVMEVSGLDDEAAEDALEPAMVTGLIEDSPSGGLRFSHALIRQTLYEGLSKLRRTRLHGRIADALARDATADAVTVAHHSLEATASLGPDVVVPRVIAAASAAAARLGFAQAQSFLTRTANWLEELPDTPEILTHRCHLQDQLALLIGTTQGQAAPATMAAWQHSRELHSRVGGVRSLIGPMGALNFVYLFQGRLDDSAALSAELLQLGIEAGDDLVGLVGHTRAGAADVWRGNISAACDQLHQARRLMEQLSDEDLDSVLPYHPGWGWRTYLAVASWFADDPSWSRWQRSAVELQPRLRGSALAQALFVDLVLVACRGTSDAAGVVEQAAGAGERAELVGFPQMASLARITRNWARQETRTNPFDCLATMERDVEDYLAAAGDGNGCQLATPICLAMLADAQRKAGNVDRAMVAVERGLAEAQRTREALWEPELLRIRGEVLAEIQLHAATQSVRAAIDLARSQGSATLLLRAERTLASLGGLPAAPVDH